MPLSDSEILTYQACCGLDGSINRVEIVKRNGRAVPQVRQSTTTYFAQADGVGEEKAQKLFRQISRNLTPIERRTFRKLALEERSIAQTAAEERVSRGAIYARLCGNSKGQGGMIAKNEFVHLWWLRRRFEDEDNY